MAEAVISVFVLVTGFVVMSRLFHVALRYQAMVEAQQTAAVLAESQMEQIRGWSAEEHLPGKTPFTDWSGCPGLGSAPAADDANFTIVVNTTAHKLFSPCFQWEKLYSLPDQRSFERACRRVRVRVSWGGRSYTLESLVSAPGARPTMPVGIKVTPDSALSIPPNANRSFSAEGRHPSKADNLEAMYVWYIYGPGDGTMVQRRDGSNVTLTNQMLDAADPPAVTGYGSGDCFMRALAHVRGKRVYGDSDTVTLLAPP